jgi:hypothetical protein
MATVATLTLVALTLWRVVTTLRGLLHSLTRASEQLNQALTELPQANTPARPETTLVDDVRGGPPGTGRLRGTR